jgi:hypothetical protein
MSPIVSPAKSRERFPRPQLRLLRGNGEPHPEGLPTSDRGRPGLRVLGGEHVNAPVVLLAGSEAARRVGLRRELAGTLSRRTAFAEADSAAEVLEQAPTSRLVVLAGDLEDLSGEAIIRLLAHRHPHLPVISVESGLPAVATGRR